MSVMSQFDSDRVKMFDKMLFKMSSYIFINTICCLVAVMSDSFATPWTMAHQAPVHGISQARILEWVAISFFRGSSQPRD